MAERLVPPRIFCVTFTDADGVKRRRYVRCPYYIKDPGASLQGLTARLAALEMEGRIVSATVSVPATLRHRAACPGHGCECFPRWTSVPELAA